MAATLVQRLGDHALRRPGETAVTFLTNGEHAREELTYGDLHHQALTLARALRDRSLAGERVLLGFPSGLPFIVTLLGCMYAGATPVPVAPARARDDAGLGRIDRVARDCAAAAVICAEPVLDAHRRRGPPPAGSPTWMGLADVASTGGDATPAPVGEDDIAFLQYTSGSTANPRGVIVTHANLAANIAATTEAMAIDPETLFVSWLPLHHDMGLIGMLLQALYGGNRLVLMSPQHFLQRPQRWLEAIDRFGGVLSGGPNFAYDLCVKRTTPQSRATLDLSSWRVAYNGAEPIRPAVMAAFAEAFAPAGFSASALFPCYGLAETTLYATGGHAGQAANVGRFDPEALAQGRAVAETCGVEVAGCGVSPDGHAAVIVDPRTRAALAEGQIGEVLLSGPSIAAGYWGSSAISEGTFGVRVAGDERQFLATGDLGFLWRGELFVTGRIKDLIVLRGRNIYPQDIELTAERCDPDAGVNGCVAFAETVRGEERLVIVKEVRHERSPDLAALAARIARRVVEVHEIQPYRVVLTRLGAIPRTSSGKVRRGASRDALARGETPVLVEQCALAATAELAISE